MGRCYGAGLDAENPRGGNRIGAAAGQSGLLHRQRDLRSREQGVVPFGHQDRAGMATNARKLHAQGAGSGNAFHDANGNVVSLQQRPLFDV